VVLALLAEAGTPLSKREIGARLAAGGVDPARFERAWRTVQERVRFDDHVIYDRQRYRWTEQPREIPLEEQLFRLTRTPDASTSRKVMALLREAMEAAAASPAELARARERAAEAEARIAELQRRLDELAAAANRPDPGPAAPAPAEPAAVREQAAAGGAESAAAPQPPAVRQAQAEPGHAPAPDAAADADAHAQYERAERRRLARERQARIEAMSTVAELAGEVEELTAKRAAPEVLLEHTRALTSGRGLEAIAVAGQVVPFTEEHHEPVGTWPDEGEPVTVIRPGYLWHAPGEAVLISKALVTRAKASPQGGAGSGA